MANCFNLPDLGIGLGLRSAHYAEIIARQPEVGWFEIISENYMQTAGRPLEFLDEIAARYPVVMHGVALSIGSSSPLDWEYLRELRALRDRIGARWVSDHLCFTGVAGKNTHDLLPMPYTEEALRHVVERIQRVQDYLGAPLAIENPSTYAELAGASMPEWEFLGRAVEQANAAILLDVNNVYVSAYNHGFDALQYLAELPFERVVQVHVAGHTHCDTHILDSHIGPVIDPVWRLLSEAWRRNPGLSVMLEWDAEIPSFEVVQAEALKAEAFRPRPSALTAPPAGALTRSATSSNEA